MECDECPTFIMIRRFDFSGCAPWCQYAEVYVAGGRKWCKKSAHNATIASDDQKDDEQFFEMYKPVLQNRKIFLQGKKNINAKKNRAHFTIKNVCMEKLCVYILLLYIYFLSVSLPIFPPSFVCLIAA